MRCATAKFSPIRVSSAGVATADAIAPPRSTSRPKWGYWRKNPTCQAARSSSWRRGAVAEPRTSRIPGMNSAARRRKISR